MILIGCFVAEPDISLWDCYNNCCELWFVHDWGWGDWFWIGIQQTVTEGNFLGAMQADLCSIKLPPKQHHWPKPVLYLQAEGVKVERCRWSQQLLRTTLISSTFSKFQHSGLPQPSVNYLHLHPMAVAWGQIWRKAPDEGISWASPYDVCPFLRVLQVKQLIFACLGKLLS